MKNSKPLVTVILCTHKYVKYAEDQVKSIKNQSGVSINLVISIDSKNIDTIEKWTNLLKKYFNKDKYKIIQGPISGFSQNFISALINVDINSDYFAFSDHDDIWEDEKLISAINMLLKYDDSIPLLYGSRSKYVKDDGEFLTYSSNYKKPKTFKNALVQCFAGGNTMVFNKKLFNIARDIGFVKVKSHDWWLYILVTGVGGKAIYDNKSYILYRQHNQNISGGNKGFYQIFLRIRGILSGNFRSWNKTNLSYLNKNIQFLTQENKKTLYNFSIIQDGNIFKRIYFLAKTKLYRQTTFQNAGLFFAVVLKKL